MAVRFDGEAVKVTAEDLIDLTFNDAGYYQGPVASVVDGVVDHGAEQIVYVRQAVVLVDMSNHVILATTERNHSAVYLFNRHYGFPEHLFVGLRIDSMAVFDLYVVHGRAAR